MNNYFKSIFKSMNHNLHWNLIYR